MLDRLVPLYAAKEVVSCLTTSTSSSSSWVLAAFSSKPLPVELSLAWKRILAVKVFYVPSRSSFGTLRCPGICSCSLSNLYSFVGIKRPFWPRGSATDIFRPLSHDLNQRNGRLGLRYLCVYSTVMVTRVQNKASKNIDTCPKRILQDRPFTCSCLRGVFLECPHLAEPPPHSFFGGRGSYFASHQSPENGVNKASSYKSDDDVPNEST